MRHIQKPANADGPYCLQQKFDQGMPSKQSKIGRKINFALQEGRKINFALQNLRKINLNADLTDDHD